MITLVLAQILAPGPVPPIDTLVLRATTYFLAQDLLEGRGTGTRGEGIAAAFIVSQCRRLGLRAAGADYLLPLPLEQARIEHARLSLTQGGSTQSFDYPADVTPGLAGKKTLSGFSGPAVWVGNDSMITSGLGRLDLAGRVAVTDGVTGSAADDTLAARGAAAQVHVVASQALFDLYVRSRGATRLYHRDPTVVSSLLPPLPSVLAGPRAALALLRGSGVLEDPDLRPRLLPPRVAFELQHSDQQITSHNVACVLPGAAGPAGDTAIALTAHYDHLGIGVPDERGDSIYNGFSDNAAGVAMLLGIAQAFVRGDAPRLSHTLLLLFFSGEERGLLGSDYYVARPAWPVSRMRLVINLDAGAPPAPPVAWRLAGVDSTGWGAVGIAVGRARGWTITTSPPKPNSDYFPFVREGVPALFIVPGPGSYEGLSEDSSNALRRRWDHYHQAADEWAPDFPFAGLARYAGYALAIAAAADTADAGRLSGRGRPDR